MTPKEIKQAIEQKIPVLIDNSWLFSSEPTIILSVCGNPDYVKVKGSDDSYEIWRVKFQHPLEQMVHAVTEGVSVIVGEHSGDCEAVGWVKSGETPFEWNVMQPNMLQCNNKGQSVKGMNYEGNDVSVWYQLDCASNNCNCKKRIKASAIAIL